MADANHTESALEAAAGAAGPHTTDAFELLSNETRLAILLALWEAYDPHGTEEAVSFSALYDRVNVRDSGNFSYHLDKLVGHYVEEADGGYHLRNAGHRIVQAVIAGTGLEGRTLPPARVDRSCHRCGAPVEITYADERLYQLCTECEGNIGPESTEQAPRGTLMAWDFPPAGLAHRTPDELFVAGTIGFLRDVGLRVRGICPACSGSVEASLQVCADHEAPLGEVCPCCGTRDEIRVSYVCSVCKHGASYPVEGAVHDHPAVVAFRHAHGVASTYDIDDSGGCGRLWDHLGGMDHTLVSEAPVRVRITVPEGDETLRLVLDGDIEVVETTVARSPSGGSQP